MSKQNYRWLIFIIMSGMVFTIIGLLVFIGFTVFSTPKTAPTMDSAALYTQAAETIQAQYTLAALFATKTPEPPQVELTQTLEPTDTETSTTLPTQSPTPLSHIPSSTAIPATMIVPTFTPVALVCDRAQMVRDVTVQDYSPFAPETTFVKTWRLKNVGNCTWTQSYNLVFVSGNALDAKLIIPLPKNVEPNQTVDLSIKFKAPKNQGTYRGDWMLSNPAGARFGVGVNGEQTFWVTMRVMNTVNASLLYDFAGNYCQAEWSSSAGRLPCPGTSSATEGFVIVLDAPLLENRQEDEWTLWTHPNNNTRGWLSGMYPEFTIQPNQRFTAWAGCLAESKGCNVNFRLDFKNLKTGVIRNLGSWHEVYDGKVTQIDLDLSQHAGKHVRFILTVEGSGGNPVAANAFWFVPGIRQALPPTASPSATATPTATPTETPTETATPTETPSTP